MSTAKRGLSTAANGNDAAVTKASVDHVANRVIDTAIEAFAARGYEETSIDAVARTCGVSKRMVHYRFGNKQGLYQQALCEAAKRIFPLVETLDTDFTVPVEGVRTVISTMFDLYVKHPAAIRLLTLESLVPSLNGSSQTPIYDISSITLHLDKLLMIGQDAGAFRPGISTNDIFTIIAGISFYRTNNRDMMLNLLGVDMNTPENTEGIRRLVVDAVLAFLTTGIPDSGRDSYLTAANGDDESEADIYD